MLLLTKLYVAILVPAAILIAIAAVFAVLLAFLGRKLEVKRDEKVVEIEGLLSGANCGGCGFAGCSAFAEALANGKADLSACNATSKVNKDKIAEILGKNTNTVSSTLQRARRKLREILEEGDS